MGLLSSIAKIFKPSKDDVNKVLDTIDPPITEESCCVNGQCTCGAAETADELVNDMLHASTIAAQKERQKEEQNHEEPKHEFESIPVVLQRQQMNSLVRYLVSLHLLHKRNDRKKNRSMILKV